MKTFITLIFLFTGAYCFSQVPQSFKYQAAARDNGAVISSSGVGVQFTILKDSPTGAVVYQERQFPETNKYGVFSISIGEGTVTDGDFSNINWEDGSYFLKVDLDPSGGASYTEMGTSEIATVPYALYSEKAGIAINDGDTDSDNEIQSLSLNNDDLTLSSGGGSISLDDYKSYWYLSGGDLKYKDGPIKIGDDVSDAGVFVRNNSVDAEDVGVIFAEYSGTEAIDGYGMVASSVPTDYYGIGGRFTGGYRGLIGEVFPTEDNSYTGVLGQAIGGTGTNYGVSATASGAGTNYGLIAEAYGGSTNYAAFLIGDTRLAGDLEVTANTDILGQISVSGFSNFGTQFGQRFITSSGVSRSYGPNSENVYVGYPVIGGTGYLDNGFVNVLDANGDIQAGMYVTASGQGEVYADIKNFRMDDPENADREIWYACIEGPEAGAYDRGTAILQNGEVRIYFSDHFKKVISAESITVSLTPGSADSKGLAVIDKTENGFVVKELFNGNGNYQFDWEVKAVRKGYENYKVVRLKSNLAQVPEAKSNRVIKEFKEMDKNKKDPKNSN